MEGYEAKTTIQLTKIPILDSSCSLKLHSKMNVSYSCHVRQTGR